MFNLSENNMFMVCGSAVDLRKGIDPLSRIVRSSSMSPTDGCVYVLMNNARTRMKLLHWERGGYVIFYKRMEQGRISHTIFGKSDHVRFHQIRWDDLMLLVAGICCSAKRRKRFNFSKKAKIKN
ncbi:MAG: IS66 family insertion sequence element accessory protein TnpB [Bacteroidaceae bacterium]|nr:IS66 family insertion sequence element accessory protein TnpB [Bacteroidaceae bacterium]